MSEAPLRFLADESCDFAVVRALRQAVSLVVREQGERLRGAFTVVEPGHVRIGRPPWATG